MNKRELRKGIDHNLCRYSCGYCDWIKFEQKHRKRRLGYEQPKLLERVKKLEQAVEEIWGNCECVRRRTKVKEKYSASVCEGCEHSYGLCICEPEEPEDHECERECPTSPCVKCEDYWDGGWGC